MTFRSIALKVTIVLLVSTACNQQIVYEHLYDSSCDSGQFYLPEMKGKISAFWNCTGALDNKDHNNPNLELPNQGLQYHLLCESLAGIVNRAYEEGKSDVYMWLNVENLPAYEAVRSKLGIEIGKGTAFEILNTEHEITNGLDPNIRQLVKGYILTDIRKNPESAHVATTAAHVYDAVIIDVRDQEYADIMGLEMLYDASNKTTEDAWREFKKQCSPKALIVMPVETGELKEYAIKNRLFTININKVHNDASQGQNNDLFDEILDWLEPNAPVLGWEGGVGEDHFVDKVSSTAHLMQPADWSYNTSLTSFNYTERQPKVLADVIDPRTIDYEEKGNFLSFFLSDGDNYQVMMREEFMDRFAKSKSAEKYKISFGICAASLSQFAPDRLEEYFEKQYPESTIMETFGGGYFYADTYGIKNNREENLSILADRVSKHMRQHRLKILHLMTHDAADSPLSQEAYEAFIKANDQLEGIVVIQYAPYNGGYGKTMWFTNSAGYDIPVVTTKYSIWDLKNSKWQCAPEELAKSLDAEAQEVSHSFVCIHAWSNFNGVSGPETVEACMNSVKTNYHAVSAQELIWRIRMRDRKEQTEQFFSTLR